MDVENSLKAQLLEAVEEPYVLPMQKKYIGYLGFSVRDLLDNLLLRYGIIIVRDLFKNVRKIQDPLDTGGPIDLYFKHLEDCREYEIDVNDPISEITLINTEYHALTSTVLYKLSCKDFKKLKEED